MLYHELMVKSQDWLDKCFKNKNGRVVLWQMPNVPLWTWLVFSIVANLFMHGRPHRLFDSVAFGALFTWAYLEISSGVNYFRRILGGIILILIIINRI